jgi:hypothetical protein
MGMALRDGSTDTGHEGSIEDASFALGHPEKVVDFGYRAVHEMTVKAGAMNGSVIAEQIVDQAEPDAKQDQVMDHEELFIALHAHLPAEIIYEKRTAHL